MVSSKWWQIHFFITYHIQYFLYGLHMPYPVKIQCHAVLIYFSAYHIHLLKDELSNASLVFFSMWSIYTKLFNNMTTRGHLKDVWGQTLAALLKLCRQFPGRKMVDFSPCFHWMMSALLHTPLKPFSFGNMSYITHIMQGTKLLWFIGTVIATL